MVDVDDGGTGVSAPTRSHGGVRSIVRTSLIAGAAITVPLLVTVVVVAFVASTVTNLLGPFVTALSWLPVGVRDPLVLELATILLLVLVIGVVGYLSAYRSTGNRLERRFDEVMCSLPGVGAVYESFDQMSELLLDADADSFQEVVLVEYPREGSYALAFQTATSPETVRTATDSEEMLTLFVPMAPNPLMGGFVLHVPTERVLEIDLTVEEGIRSIVTSGVATGATAETPETVPPSQRS